MTRAIGLIVLGLFFMVGCAEKGEPDHGPGAASAILSVAPPTRPASATGSTVRDVRIEIALFGSGTHLVDVTDRVIQLLLAEPQGFVARANTLNIDPVPGKNKSLLIRYRYHDQERLYLITGQNRASYALLTGRDEAR